MTRFVRVLAVGLMLAVPASPSLAAGSSVPGDP